ncbi:hypothetical protein J2736_003839 [Paenibacillus qinlingensis]|uniref:Uncharacterized protein n=1 Tax=Paenibacillus qinlingensis TaxID=1837343 RepID=A0ABU1P043_9BACL|nr:hypothetical protein [Paenibacillus qinlingensis]
MSTINEVVVVLPSDPVTPTIGQGHSAKNSAISLVTRLPLARAISNAGWSGRMPGVRNTTSPPTRSR